MSINYLYDFVIHYHTYKNIDLVNQGIYNIKTKIFTNFNNKRYYAVPYYFTESKVLENMSQTDEETITAHCIINPKILENNFEYITKSFIIRYSDEEIELDEFCYFRLEIPSNINLNDIEIDIRFYIEFSDFNNSSNVSNFLKGLKFKKLHFVNVNIINEGISKNFIESYTPIVYYDNFSSLLNVSIHRVLSDFKLRISKNYFPFAIESPKEKSDDKKNEKDEKIDLNNNKFTNLIDCFYDEKTEIPANIPNDIIDKLYNKYVLNLISSYVYLKRN
jgi:hypothetical protein